MLFRIRQFIKHISNFIDPMWEMIYRVLVGVNLLHQMKERMRGETHFFLIRGATGDAYIQLMLLNNWIRENRIKSYVLLGDATGIEGLTKIYRDANFIHISGYRAECVEKAYMLLGGEVLDLTIMFPWAEGFYFNRCRVRMIERFNFIDTYKWYVFGLKENIEYSVPLFRNLDEKMRSELIEMGIVEKKTVIIAPEANSVTRLSEEFWNEVIIELKKRGFAVYVNCKNENTFCAESIFFTYWESVPTIDFAGYFIAIRSGLCDIVSSSKAKKIIIYPEKGDFIDYGEHRSEIDFCGLKEMGITDMKSDLIEIGTPLIQNITQSQNGFYDDEYYKRESCVLKDKILVHFR